MNNQISDDEEGEAPHVTDRPTVSGDAHPALQDGANILVPQPGRANAVNASRQQRSDNASRNEPVVVQEIELSFQDSDGEELDRSHRPLTNNLPKSQTNKKNARGTFLGMGILPSDDVSNSNTTEHMNIVAGQNNKVHWKDGKPVVISRTTPNNNQAVSDTKALDDMIFDLQKNYIHNPVHSHCRPEFSRLSIKDSLNSNESRVEQTISRKPAFSRVQVGAAMTLDTEENEDTHRGNKVRVAGVDYLANSPHEISVINGQQDAPSFLHMPSSTNTQQNQQHMQAQLLHHGINKDQMLSSGGPLLNQGQSFQQGVNNAATSAPNNHQSAVNQIDGAQHPDTMMNDISGLSKIEYRPQNSWSQDLIEVKDKNVAPTPNLLLPATLNSADKLQQQQIVEEVPSPSFQQSNKLANSSQAALAANATANNNTSSTSKNNSQGSKWNCLSCKKAAKPTALAVAASQANTGGRPKDLSEIQEVPHDQEGTNQNQSNSHDVSSKVLLPHQQLPANKTKGSMKDIASKRPAKLQSFAFRANSEELHCDKFFTSEGTPIKRMNTLFNLKHYERTKSSQIVRVLSDNVRQKTLKHSSVFENLLCVSLSWILAVLGTVLLAISLIVDLAYLSTVIFSSQGIYVICFILVVLRFTWPFLNTLRFVCLGELDRQLRLEEEERLQSGAGAKDDDEREENTRHFKRNGVLLYLGVPLSQVTGIYRMLNFKNFSRDHSFGLGADCLLNMLAMLIIQAINNSQLNSEAAIKEVDYELSPLQSFAIITKLLILTLLIVECIMYIVQLRYLHQSQRIARINDYRVKMGEKEKRGFFGNRYFAGALAWLVLCMLAFLVTVLQLSQPECRVDQVASQSNDQICLDCTVQYCESCTDSGAQDCDVCLPGYYLDKSEPGIVSCVDAKCRIGECKTCEAKGPFVCDVCNDGYEVNELTGLCKSSTCEDVNCRKCTNYNAGICDECFETHEWDRGVSVCADKECKEKIPNCLICGDEKGCEQCARNYAYDLQKEQCVLQCEIENCQDCSEDVAKCKSCKESFWLDEQNQKCIDASCQVQECGTCDAEGPSVCDKCNDGFELEEASGLCRSAVCADKNCRECTNDVNSCEECMSGFAWDSEWSVCAGTDCQIEKCLVCHRKDSIENIQKCVQCEDGFVYDSLEGKCAPPCTDPHCTSCSSDPDKCNACAEQFWLDTEAQTCIDATCKDVNCKDCKSQGPNVCQECSDGFQIVAAKDGLCISTSCPVNFRFNAETGDCDDTVCKKTNCEVCEQSGIHDGCDRCTDGYYFDDQTKECERDGTCNVDECAKCVDDPAICDQCDAGFWLDKDANKCLDATCQVDGCDDCSVGGPSKCDSCSAGYFAKDEATCVSCNPDPAASLSCIECSDENTCTKCIDGFRVEDGKCLDLTCQVEECATCDAHPSTCEQCNEGFWLDQAANTCLDATCLIDNCDTCSILGPSKCDTCKVGYFAKDETTCADCDAEAGEVICEECSEDGTCTKCAAGYYLEDGECKTCDLTLCKECDPLTGKCMACKENLGIYLDSSTGKCEKCTEPCLECSSPTFCLLCNDAVHKEQQPIDGQCRCDQQRGWETAPDQPNPFKCACKRPWLDKYDQCTSCEVSYPGCSECSRVDSQDEIERVTTVKENPYMPDTQPGAYICSKCSEENTFFNLFWGFCMRCDRDVSGCKRCSDGNCSECLEGYVLDSNGGCFDCKYHDSQCVACTQDKCTKCLPGFISGPIPGLYCFASPI